MVCFPIESILIICLFDERNILTCDTKSPINTSNIGHKISIKNPFTSLDVNKNLR